MATTKLWKIKGWIGKVLLYAEDPEKTETPIVLEDFSESTDTKALEDVIHYAMRLENTKDSIPQDRLVTGINCLPETARDEMQAVKIRFGKNDGIMAFHGYQSFAEGEVTPQTAHEIGIQLASELWGDRFQVLVATHVDKPIHIHNHFVINSVSFIDGYRYNHCRTSYQAMRDTSDRLCLEYGLSVVEPKDWNSTRPYAQWLAEKQGQSSIDFIRQEIDEVIADSTTDKQFFYKLKQKGYMIKMGKDITVRPLWRDRGIKLERHFGSAYSYEGICQRLMDNLSISKSKPETSIPHFKLTGPLSRYRRYTGLSARFLIYTCRVRNYAQVKPLSDAQIEFIYKEDLYKLRQISQEAQLLCTHHIETSEQLFSFQEKSQRILERRMQARRHLRYQLRAKHRSPTEKETIREQIQHLNVDIERLRKEVELCEDIARRSEVIHKKLEITYQERQKRKEVKENEYRRRSR